MQVIYRFNEPEQLTARIVLDQETEQPRCWATRQGAHKWAKSQVFFLRHGFFTREYTPLVPDVPPDPRKCRECGYIGIAKDAGGQEFAEGAHVNNTGLCWFCWLETPEGAEHKATKEED